jgi:hypothetical protein
MLLAAGTLWSLGCAGGGGRSPEKPQEEAANSSLMALGSGDADGFWMQSAEGLEEEPSTEDLVNQAAVDLERLLGPQGKLRPSARVASADNESGLVSVSSGDASGVGGGGGGFGVARVAGELHIEHHDT